MYLFNHYCFQNKFILLILAVQVVQGVEVRKRVVQRYRKTPPAFHWTVEDRQCLGWDSNSRSDQQPQEFRNIKD